MLTATKNQREFYRIVYPVNSGRKFKAARKRELAEVIELSQGGLRIRGAMPGVRCGDVISGTILFAGEPIMTIASVKRVCEDYTALVFIKPLPILNVLNEQIRIRREYPS
ncbi:MAG: hypothetical protein NTW52_10650 [Planctomycetota bacterium]|nr:hypothetical protein [Planctomycetota bacterium]